MLSEGMLGPLEERQRGYVNDILSSGRHLLKLVDDILDLSNIEAGRMELELSEFAVQDMLENAVAIVRAWSIRQGLHLRSELTPELGKIRADERKLKQVMFNLLSNAVRRTPRGGDLMVGARRDGEELVVFVRDSGPGIAPDDQSHVFDEFYWAADDGAGLGLALARKFIEL